MTITRRELLADPRSGARPLDRGEQGQRARDAELAAQWLPATSPSGRRCQVQVSQADVLDDMHRAGRHIRQPARLAEPNAGPEAG